MSRNISQDKCAFRADGYCRRCGVPYAGKTPGCSACWARHRARERHNALGVSNRGVGLPICPQCWRTAGKPLAACSIRPENYGEIIKVENQWSPIYTRCTVCIHVRPGTVPLDSPRVYLPVNPGSKRTSKNRVYPTRAHPVYFMHASCRVCGGEIDEPARCAGRMYCAKHWLEYRKKSRNLNARVAQENTVCDAGLEAFLAARRARTRGSTRPVPRRARPNRW